MSGHKEAYAHLQPCCPGWAGAAQDGQGRQQHAHAPALLWPGRVLSVGRGEEAIVKVRAALASRQRCVIQAGEPGTGAAAWLTDCSAHGTLVLALPDGAAVGSAEQLAGLEWGRAHLVRKATHRLAAGPHLLVVGAPEFHMAAADGRTAGELRRTGAAFLLFDLLPDQKPNWVQGPADPAAALEGPPASVSRLLARLAIAQTPSKPDAAAGSQPARPAAPQQAEQATRKEPQGGTTVPGIHAV